MRHITIVMAVIAAAASVSGCATTENTPQVTDATPTQPAFQSPATGSLLPARHRVGNLPVDVYDAEALRRQGITSAAGALRQIPQNTGR